MSTDHISQTIHTYEKQISELEGQIRSKKQLVNHLCKDIDREPLYSDVEDQDTAGRSLAIAADEFFTKPLATAVTVILEKRKAAGLGPATLDELYSGMIQGGFVFDAKSASNAKRSLATAVAKNSYTFVKLPNGSYGLKQWYPNLPKTGGGKRELSRGTEEGKKDFDANPVEDREAVEFRAAWDSNGAKQTAKADEK